MAVDDTNDQYENIPIDETLSVIQDSSANQNVSNVQDVPKAQVSSTNQEISTRPTSSIANVDFTPVSSKKNKNDGAIIIVDFGDKGDAQYTAVKTGDDAYKVEKRNKTSGYFIAFGCIIASLIIFALVI